MPLPRSSKDTKHEITNLPLRQRQNQLSIGIKDHEKEYNTFDGDSTVFDMDTTLVHRPDRKPSLRTPVLPQRSTLRTVVKSKKEVSDPNSLVLKSSDEFPNVTILKSSDPHDIYLSSEEEISVKDCNEDFLFDSDDSDINFPDDCYNKESQENTAKYISIRVVGKPQIIEISCHSNNTSPRPSLSITDCAIQRPLLPRLPALTFTLGDFHIDDKELFPSSPPPLSTQKPDSSLDSNELIETNLCKISSESKLPKSISETSSSLSILRRGSLISRRSKINQSLLQMPSHVNGNTSATVTKISSPITALKRVSRNIRNTGIPKISLAYTPGVVPRRL